MSMERAQLLFAIIVVLGFILGWGGIIWAPTKLAVILSGCLITASSVLIGIMLDVLTRGPS